MKNAGIWIAAVLAVASFISFGCTHTRIEDFPFINIDGSSIQLNESPSFPPGEEGLLIFHDGVYTTPEYSFKEEISTGKGTGLFINYFGALRGRIRIFYKNRTEEYPLPTGNSPVREALFPLQNDNRLEGFQIEADSPNSDFRIRAAGLSPYKPEMYYEESGPVIPIEFELFTAPGRREGTVLPGHGKPFLRITYSYTEEEMSLDEPRIHIQTAAGDLLWTIFPLLGRHEVFIPVSATALPIIIKDSGHVVSVALDENSERHIDLGLLLDPEDTFEGDFVFFRWSDFPEILIFDTADYHIQALLFKRLAFYVEKRGFSGRILENDLLENLHGWNAHDYRSEDLADFFNEADDLQIELNSHEKKLRDILIEEEVIGEEAGKAVSRAGGLLSVSRESTPYLRELFLAHEGYHGIYFASPAFEDFALDMYESIDPQARIFWKIFLAWKGYDIDNDYLVANEIQAYLLQQPLERVEAYYKEYNIPRMLELFPDHQETLLYMQNESNRYFYDSALKLHEYMQHSNGYGAGNLFTVRPGADS